MARRFVRAEVLKSIIVGIFVALLAVSPHISVAEDVDRSQLMSLHVKDTPAGEVFKIIADQGGFNLAVGAGIVGKLTLFVNDIPPRDLLEMVVGILDVAFVEENGAVWILKKDLYLRRYGEEFGSQLTSKVIELNAENPEGILQSIRAIFGANVEIAYEKTRNVFVVKANPEDIREIEQIISQLDSRQITESFVLNHIPVGLAKSTISELVGTGIVLVEDKIGRASCRERV